MPRTFLAVFENNEFGNLPHLREEKRELDRLLRPFCEQHNLRYISESNIGILEFIRRIETYKESLFWLHFSGHHDENRGIRLMDGNFRELLPTLRQCKNLKGIFINGCTSKESLISLNQISPICIGTNNAINDKIAAIFATRFYECLCNNQELTYDIIHNTFEITISQLPSFLHVPENQRGGGNTEALHNTDYEISQKSEELKIRFVEGHLFFINKIDSYQRNGGFEEYIETEFNTNPLRYYTKIPKLFQLILKPLFAENLWDDIKILGKERYKLFKTFYNTYLNLYRYSILSILWDEIIDNKLFEKDSNVTRMEVKNLLVLPAEFSLNGIITLEKLIKTIDIHGSSSEKKFAQHLKPSISTFKDYYKSVKKDYKPIEDDNRLYWETELLIQKLLKNIAFLNNYRIRSVLSKSYKNYRNFPKAQFQIECYSYKGKYSGTEEDFGYQFENIHSIYLCEEKGNDKVIINLSPFYFDKNSTEVTSKKINLFALQCYSQETQEYTFEEIEDMSENHPREQIDISQYDQMEELKSKMIFQQLNHFLTHLE